MARPKPLAAIRTLALTLALVFGRAALGAPYDALAAAAAAPDSAASPDSAAYPHAAAAAPDSQFRSAFPGARGPKWALVLSGGIAGVPGRIATRTSGAPPVRAKGPAMRLSRPAAMSADNTPFPVESA